MKRKTILIVDDEPTNRLLLQSILEMQYHLLQATNGEEALQVVQDERPDLILLDVKMPVMDGFECCKRLKADHRTKEIPVIFITARDTSDDELQGLEIGAVDYVSKPFNWQILNARIKTHLKIQSQNASMKRIIEQELVKITEQDVMLKNMLLSSKSELLKDISHHWRNPLNIIVMLLQMLQETEEEESAEEYRARVQSYLDRALEAAMGLSQNIDGFRKMFVSDAEMEMTINLHDQITQNIRLLQPLMNDKQIEVSLDVPEGLEFSGTVVDFNNIIYQVLKNSVEAVLEHQNDLGEINIKVRTPDGGDSVSILISDNGGGVCESVSDNLFEPYVSGKSVESGRGMGLFIAHQIAHVTYKGDIMWQNSEGGAVFTIVLRSLG